MIPGYHGLEKCVQMFKNLNLKLTEAFDFPGMTDITYLLEKLSTLVLL